MNDFFKDQFFFSKTRGGSLHKISFDISNTYLVSCCNFNPKCPCIKKRKAGDRSQGRPEGSLFNSYYTEV